MTKTTFGDQQNPDEPDWVTELIDDIDDVDPPPALVREVMARIARPSESTTSGWGRPRRFSGGTVMTKKVLWAVAAAAVLLIAVMAITGFPPTGKGVEGTIGAAKRYQAEQISNKDVKLQDPELQTLLQSDAWARVTRDKAAWNALTNKEVQRLFTAPGVQGALSNQTVMDALSVQSVQQALAAPGVAAALSSQGV